MTLGMINQDKNIALQAMLVSMKKQDEEGFKTALNQLFEANQKELLEKYEELKNVSDKQILASRGVRVLTSQETQYYKKIKEAFKSSDPKQVLSNLDVVMPETIIDNVFDELQNQHPLLENINFQNTHGMIKFLTNTNGYQKAVWGKLCNEIKKELSSGWKEIDMTLLKLAAFIPVCEAMLDLGPQWLDSYVRQVLYDALANGLEDGIINNLGSDTGPIGMIADLSKGTVSNNVVSYVAKTEIPVTKFDPVTLGGLIGNLAVDENNKPRVIRSVMMIVNPQDYFTKIFLATTVMAADGTYRNDVFPYPIKVIQSPAVAQNKAVLGLGYRYFMGIGMSSKDGRIEYSDEYQFVEDNRVYKIKLYANGMPMDNNAFQYLDITNLKPHTVKVVVEEIEGTVTTKPEATA